MALFKVKVSFPGGEPGEELTERQIYARAKNADIPWLISTLVLEPMGGAAMQSVQSEPHGLDRLDREVHTLTEANAHLTAENERLAKELAEFKGVPPIDPDKGKAKDQATGQPTDGGPADKKKK